MKKTMMAALAFVLTLSSAAAVSAAPFKASENKPNIVANYPDGTHGIVGENETHTGADVVMRAGKSGVFQQWFYGTSSEDGTHGDHSVWKVLKDNQSNTKGDIVQQPNPAWGDYLVPGVDYVVITNDFHVVK